MGDVMKREINGSETIYLISLFCMPIITFIGIILLLSNILEISEALTISKCDISEVFFGEIILFISCWILLFSSYVFHKMGWKTGQIGIITIAFGILFYSIYTAVNTLSSIAVIINPVIVVIAALYGLMKPLPDVTIQKRKTRVKNSLAKYKPTKKKSPSKTKSNKK